MPSWLWIIALLVVVGLAWAVAMDRRFRAMVRQRYPLRMYDLRAFRWLYHDLFLRHYLRAMVDPSTTTVVVTGDSTLAQANLDPADTVSGQLVQLAELRGNPPVRFLNVAVNGTAEAYLHTSIGLALKAGARHVVAGLTIRDYTQVDEGLARSPKSVFGFLRYRNLLNDFAGAADPLTTPQLVVARLAFRILYWATGPLVVQHARLRHAAPAEAKPRVTVGDQGAAPRAPATGLYVSPEELSRRIQGKNERRDLLLERNPFVQRLEVVMRDHAAQADRISFVLMPMNRAIDIDRFGLDPSIPVRLAEQLSALGRRWGYRVHELGALWDGRRFAPDDVVHLNRQGSAVVASTLAREAPLADYLPRFDPLPLERLVEHYRSSVDDATFARTVQFIPEDESFRLVALGATRSYLSVPLDGPLLLAAETRRTSPGPGPRLKIVGAGEEPLTLADIEIVEGRDLRVRAHGPRIEVVHGPTWTVSSPTGGELRLGYLDDSTADREFQIRVGQLLQLHDEAPSGRTSATRSRER